MAIENKGHGFGHLELITALLEDVEDLTQKFSAAAEDIDFNRAKAPIELDHRLGDAVRLEVHQRFTPDSDLQASWVNYDLELFDEQGVQLSIATFQLGPWEVSNGWDAQVESNAVRNQLEAARTRFRRT